MKKSFSIWKKKTELTRFVDPAPFIAVDGHQMEQRCESLPYSGDGTEKEAEAYGMQKCHSRDLGGLDSTLALLVTAKASSRY